MTSKLTPLLAVGLLGLSFSACERENVGENPLQWSCRSVQEAGATLLHVDLPTLYHQASQLGDAEWVDLPAMLDDASFPLRSVRRSPILPRDAKFYTSDGKKLFEQPRPDLMAIEGMTADGRRGVFALSPAHFAGWYEAPEGRMFVQDFKFDFPEAETGDLFVLSEKEWRAYQPFVGSCATPPQPGGKPAPVEGQGNFAMPEVNCFKTEVIMHGDYDYFAGICGGDINIANWGMLAYAIASDVAFEGMNTDLVVPMIVINQGRHPLPTDPNALLNLMQAFWSQVNISRDDVFFVTGMNLDGSTVGMAYIGVICNNWPFSVGLAEWQRSPLSGLTLWQSNSRIGGHEFGHNFGANHTSSGLMHPIINDLNSGDNFSQASLNEIFIHIINNYGCLTISTCD